MAEGETSAGDASKVASAVGAGAVNDDGLSNVQRRRLQDRKEWEAYWKIRDLDTKDAWYPRLRYHVHRFFDKPATWFREKIVEPLHDKYQMPYYHRRLTRVPEIDMCGVDDQACLYEANEQYRFDKLVDYYIVQTLHDRIKNCVYFNPDDLYRCTKVIEDFELAELNNFIKYGELGTEQDVRGAYMKQKHRMIWERRHPEVMAERERQYQEYLKKKEKGIFDSSFWKGGLPHQDKKNMAPIEFDVFYSKPAHEGDQPLSRDWQYYKKVAQDPEFDKEQGKTSSIPKF